MKRKEWINLIIILVLLGFSYYRYNNRTYNASQTQILMDTQVEIYLVSKTNNTSSLLVKAFDLIREYEQKFSYYDEQSTLYQINNSNIESHIIDEDFYQLLLVSEKLYYDSNMLYDVSIGVLSDLWDFENEIIPEYKDIKNAQDKIGFNRITYSEDSLNLPLGMKLNFGSISKGFIIDKVMDFLKSNNVTEAYINAGGDIKFYSSGKKKWRVGIQHPRFANQVILSLSLPDMAVVTSGDYERYFIKDNIRYHHIINPKTGYPAKDCVSVTVFSKDAMIADALSTTALLMNPFDAIELIKTFPDTEAVIYFYDENNEPVSLKTIGTKKWNITYK